MLLKSYNCLTINAYISLCAAGDAGWPVVGAVRSIPELISGKVGKESYVYKLCAKYGTIARVNIPGEYIRLQTEV